MPKKAMLVGIFIGNSGWSAAGNSGDRAGGWAEPQRWTGRGCLADVYA